jgi:hypothetical protein
MRGHQPQMEGIHADKQPANPSPLTAMNPMLGLISLAWLGGTSGVWLGVLFIAGLVILLTGLVRLGDRLQRHRAAKQAPDPAERRHRRKKDALDPAERCYRREKHALLWACGSFALLSLAGAGDGLFRYLVQKKIEALRPFDDGDTIGEVDRYFFKTEPWLSASMDLVIVLSIAFLICLARWILAIRTRRRMALPESEPRNSTADGRDERR